MADKPDTLVGEIRRILAEAKEPLTRIEVFERCKIADDEKKVSQTLSALCSTGEIKRTGELKQPKGHALVLYAIAGGGAAKAQKPRAARSESRALVVRAQPVQDPGFRAGIFSDGSLDIERAGETFQMNPGEARALYDYLNKVMEP